MKSETRLIIAIAITISAVTWLVSVWQYNAMMSSMMMFSINLNALSLFIIIWTAGMAAMMFPAIIPMILVYNRLIGDNENRNSANNNQNNQLIYHKSNGSDKAENANNGIRNAMRKSRGRNAIYNIKYFFQKRPYNITAFVSAYLAVWALTGVILLVGWSLFLNTLLLHLGIEHILQMKQQQHLLINTIYAILLIISGIYQFSPLKTRCLGYCESPLSFFMRRWSKGVIGAVKMGAYHGLYCLGCCWPYFLLMVALGWMNVFWMGLFAAIIFAEKIWSKGGLWIARITGTGFIIFGILSWAGIVTLPINTMNNFDSNRISMNMPMSTQQSHDMMMMSHSSISKNSSISGNGNDINNNADSKSNDMTGMVMKMIMVVNIYRVV
jgi:predicted metal-binding membrane protein